MNTKVMVALVSSLSFASLTTVAHAGDAPKAEKGEKKGEKKAGKGREKSCGGEKELRREEVDLLYVGVRFWTPSGGLLVPSPSSYRGPTWRD